MRWILAFSFVLATALPALAQEDEPTLGVSTEPSSTEREPGPSDASASEPDTSASDAGASEGGASAADVAVNDEDGAAGEEPAREEPPSAEAADEDASADDEDAAAEDGEEDAGPPPPHWTDERTAAWVTFVTSFALAVGGGVVLAVGVDEINTIENAADGTVWADVAGSLDRAPILTGVGAVVLGLGVAGTIAGATLLALYGSEGTWLEVSVLPTGISARGRF